MPEDEPKITSSTAKSTGATLFSKGVLWTGGSSAITSIIRLLIIAVLARLLAPKDFGLFSLTLLLIDFGNDLGDFGTGPAIIQRQEVSPAVLSTVFWMVMIGGTVIFIFASIISSLLAMFFHEELLTKLIIVSSISFIIRSSGLVHRTILQRDLLFNKIAVIEVGSTAFFGVISVCLAIYGLGVWSLIYGLLAHRVADVILSWLMCSFRPTFHFKWVEGRQILHFAKKVTGERITYFISSRMDYIIIGRMLDSASLGYYTLASEITSLPQKRISSIVSTVAFPTFCCLQNQIEALRNAYMKVNKTIALVTFPALGGLMVLAPEFTRTFYGTGWEPVIFPMQILCLVGVLRSIMHNNGTIFYSKNRPDLAFKWGVIQMLTIPLPLLIGARYGLMGVATALSLTSVAYFLYIQNVVNGLLHLRFIRYMEIFVSPILLTASMVAITISCKSLILATSQFGNVFIFLSCSAIAGAAYSFLFKIADASTWNELLALGKATLRPRR